MSDGLPTEEQLRRIERGVRERIDARRRIARGLVGGTAAVLLLAGGVALVRPVAVGTAGGGSSAGGSAASAGVEVRCRTSDEVRAVSAPDEPAAIAAACGAAAVDFQSGAGRMPSAASTPEARVSPSPSLLAVVICRASDGVLDVYPAGERPRTLCRRNGAEPY